MGMIRSIRSLNAISVPKNVLHMSPSYYHSAMLPIIASSMNRDRTFRAFTELTIVIDAKDYTPDISVYPWKKVDYYRGDIITMKELP